MSHQRQVLGQVAFAVGDLFQGLGHDGDGAHDEVAEIPDHEADHAQRQDRAEEQGMGNAVEPAFDLPQQCAVQLRVAQLQQDLGAGTEGHPVQQATDQHQQEKARQLFGEGIEKLHLDRLVQGL
ncbi:hypothetical protein D3C76_1038400 [compost metagenome]